MYYICIILIILIMIYGRGVADSHHRHAHFVSFFTFFSNTYECIEDVCGEKQRCMIDT